MQEIKEEDKIILDNETIFHHHLSQNKDKLQLYNKAQQEGKITYFDPTTIRRLRALYYGMYTGLIYMYGYPTDFNSIGNKIELLTYVFEDRDYEIVHASTDSTREIPFFMYHCQQHLDSSSWVEVKEGNKTWVYDPFSLLRIEKSVFYELEHPTITSMVPKKVIVSHPARCLDEYKYHHDAMDFMLIKILPEMLKKASNSPFKELLESEITRYKKDINLDQVELEQRAVEEGIISIR